MVAVAIKDTFHRSGRRVLTKLAKELKLAKGTFEVRSCVGGPAVMGEVILHSNELYVMVHDRGVLARTCNGREDYTGDRNFNYSTRELLDLHAFGLKLRGLVVLKASGKMPRL